MARQRSRNNKRDNSKTSRSGKTKKKEVEVNIDRDQINSADMREAKKYMSRENDASWYLHNPALVRDAANIGFSWPVGIEVERAYNITNFADKGSVDFVKNAGQVFNAIPGLFTAYWTPTIGLSENYTSAVNIAMQRFYAYTSYDISRTLRYDGPDLMNMLLAMDSAYSFYLMMVRAYGCMSNYSSVNRYKPIALLEAMELDFNDIQTHLSEFRYYINQYAYKLSAINVPAEVDYIIRHAWMNTGIYLDSETPEAQMYMYVQENFYQYVEVTEGPSYLQLIPWINGSKKDYTQIVSFGDQLLLSILGSQDIGIMSGDILKTFGSGNLFTFGPIPENYVTEAKYSKEVLSQFENLTVHGPLYIDRDDPNAKKYLPDITQVVTGLTGGPALASKLWFDSSAWNYSGMAVNLNLNGIVEASRSKLINMHMVDPSPEDNMVATRLTGIITETTLFTDAQSLDHRLYTFNQTGSEVVNRLRIYYNQFYAGKPTLQYAELNAPCLMASQFYASDAQAGVCEALDFFTLMSQFDWHPNLAFITANNSSSATSYGSMTYSPAFDVDNYAIVSATDLKRMHDTALLSEFAVRKAWE